MTSIAGRVDRARMMRGAGNVVGSEALARQLGVAPRTVYAMMSGERGVSDDVLHRTRLILIDHRSALSWLIGTVRSELRPNRARHKGTRP